MTDDPELPGAFAGEDGDGGADDVTELGGFAEPDPPAPDGTVRWELAEILVVVIMVGLVVSMALGIASGAASSLNEPMSEPGLIWRNIALATQFADLSYVLFVGVAIALVWWRIGVAVSTLDDRTNDEAEYDEGEDTIREAVLRLYRLRMLSTCLLVLSLLTAGAAGAAVLGEALFIHTLGGFGSGTASSYFGAAGGVVVVMFAIVGAYLAWHLRDRCTTALAAEGGGGEDEDQEPVYLGEDT